MKHILSKLKSKLGMDGFFSDEYLCKPDIARTRFASALKEALEYYQREKNKPIPPALIHDCWKENIDFG